MHIERLTKLAEWLEGGAKHETIVFNMAAGIWFKKIMPLDPQASIACGTTCCIAGAAVQFFNDLPALFNMQVEKQKNLFCFVSEIGWLAVDKEARELLDLDDVQATDLFTPSLRFGGRLRDYNDPAWAARTIRRLIETGAANWAATKAAS